MPVLKIDIHTHILPPELPKFKEMFGYGGFIQLKNCPGCKDKEMLDDTGKPFRRVQDNCFTPQTRMSEYDQHEIKVQVLSTVPVMFSYWAKAKDGHYVSQYLNDHIGQIVRENPKRFVGLATVPLQDTTLAVSEAER